MSSPGQVSPTHRTLIQIKYEDDAEKNPNDARESQDFYPNNNFEPGRRSIAKLGLRSL